MGHPQSNLRFVITGGSKKTIITFTNSPEVIANLKDLIDSFCSIHNTKNNIYISKTPIGYETDFESYRAIQDDICNVLQ